jgi:predicted molibdopterin-dependent oxidoreductase YjgC
MVAMRLPAYASAKATNEDNYVFQKMIRALLGTNNVDHCARLCHAGSVTGLQLSIGSSAMSNSIAEMEDLEAFIVTGSNTTETHPVIANFLKRSVRQKGAKLIVIDPRQIEMTNFATLWLRQKPGTDVAVFRPWPIPSSRKSYTIRSSSLNAPRAFNEYLESLETFTPEWAESVSGVPAESIREAARIYAGAKRRRPSTGAWASARAPTAPTTPSRWSIWLSCAVTSARRAPVSTPCAARTTFRVAPTAADCPTSTPPTSASTSRRGRGRSNRSGVSG